MVGRWLTLLFLFSSSSWAVLNQTVSDLLKMEDMLRFEVENSAAMSSGVTPLLVATPQHHWLESRVDFKASVMRSLKKVFAGDGQLIDCPDCDTFRLHVRKDQQLQVSNGELSVLDRDRLGQDQRYAAAKAIAFIRETPAGVSVKIVSLEGGRILYAALADSSSDLDKSDAWTNYSQELERRKRGESLSYVWLNLGVYPKPLAQIEFLEQWGSRNQHLSGIGISVWNPQMAFGGVYHYMLPWHRKLHLSASIYYSLEEIFKQTKDKDKKEDDPYTPEDESEEDKDDGIAGSKALVGQLMLQYTIGDTFGVFVSGSNQAFSLGVNFYNPLLMPFLF